MRTLKHLTFCLAAFIATGCSQEDNEPQTTVKKGTPAEFTMTINGGTGTRTITTHNEETTNILERAMKLVSLLLVVMVHRVIVNTPIIIMNGKLLA